MEKRDVLYIGGEWVTPAGGKTIEVVSPATEEVIAVVPEASEGDVDRAVAAARKAFDEGPWPQTSPSERAAMLRALSQGIQARAQEFAETITNEMGSPASFSLMGQVFSATMVFDGFADLAETFTFEEERAGLMGGVLVRRAPVGVAGAIVPWNVPTYVIAMKLGACLASGSTMVIKPAPETPLDSYLLAEVIESIGLPPGVVNFVAAGREVGEYLVRHPGIDKVSFTGSTAAGRKVGAICGEQLKRCTLELGGKSAAVILDDADLATVIPNLMPAAMMNNGQACVAQTRILAPRARYGEVVDALAAAVGAQKVGDPTDPEVAVGPLVAERQRDRVEGYLKAGRDEGARVVVGGGRPAGMTRGWYVEPTVFADVDNSMKIAREEIFGPVLSVIPYGTDDEAVKIANDSDYGLSGSVWTADRDRGVEVAKRVRTGTYAVNSGMVLDLKNPFGGFKSSGIGRELGPEGLEAYCEIQTIVLG
ncbi:MAG: Aldehyde Dehydrogenase [Acidimicrobiales bacterium]|nr:Aldehyde Dehydrogenase [Acidimicrobiales bacterium]